MNLQENNCVARFAPSPSGRMHAGNIFAALISWLFVKAYNGQLVLRIDDLDFGRSRASFAEQICKDFEYLGLTWDNGPYYQHDNRELYEESFNILMQRAKVYPCFCSRADLHAASAPHKGERFIYAGSCKALAQAEIDQKMLEKNPAYRLSVNDTNYEFFDLIQGKYQQNLLRECGDFVIRRSDGVFSYQLACVVDDASMGVNLVVRGVDLISSCPQQIYLQDLLSLPHVNYAHTPLLVDREGRRLSKRNKDASLDELLLRFGSPQAIIGHLAYLGGIIDRDEALLPESLIPVFSDLLKHKQIGNCFSDNAKILWV